MKKAFLSCLAAALVLSLGASAWAQGGSTSKQIWSKLDNISKGAYILGYQDGIANGCQIATILAADSEGKSPVPQNCAQAAALKVLYSDITALIDEVYANEKYAGLELSDILFLVTLSTAKDGENFKIEKEKLYPMLDEALAKR